MTTPQPEDVGIAAKIMAGMGAALAALGAWAWHHTHKRIDEKAEMKALDALAKRVEDHTISKDVFDEHAQGDTRAFNSLSDEISRQRGHVEKIFDELKEVRRDMSDGHKELLNAIHGIKK